MPSTEPSLELRAATVLHWLRTEQEPVLTRAGFRRPRKGEQPLTTISALLADGTVLAEVLVQLDALPHAAVLRAPRRPASSPDASPAVDSRQTAQLFKQNTRRVVKALSRVLEHLRRKPLVPGAIQAYLGADVAKTPPSTNPAPCVKLVELAIAAAMYGPDSERFIWNIWHINNASTKAVLHSTMTAVSRAFRLVPFDQVVEQANSRNPSKNVQENVLVQMGSRKISLVTDDGKQSPDADGGRSELKLPENPIEPEPVQLSHPDHHDLSNLSELEDDPELRTQRFAYQETNARLQEVARARALVSQLEGSVLGSRGLYSKKGSRQSFGPAEAPPNPNANAPGPLPSFTSFQSPVSVENPIPTVTERVLPPVVSLPALDALDPNQATIQLDDLPPTLSDPMREMKPKENSPSDDDDDDGEILATPRRISHESDCSGSVRSLSALAGEMPPLKENVSALTTRVSHDSSLRRFTAENPGDLDSSEDERGRKAAGTLYTSAVTAPSGSADILVADEGSVVESQLEIPVAELAPVDEATRELQAAEVAQGSVSRDGVSSNASSPIIASATSIESPTAIHAADTADMVQSPAVGNTSPGLPPLFLTTQKTREENLSRVAAGMRQPSAAAPPSFTDAEVAVGNEPNQPDQRKDRLASGMFASFVAKFDSPPDHPIGFPYGVANIPQPPTVVQSEQVERASEVEYNADEDAGSFSSASYQDARGSKNTDEPADDEELELPPTIAPLKVPSTPPASKMLDCPKTPPTPPTVSDVVARFAVKSPDLPREKSARVVSTMSPSPKLFQKLLSVWQVSSDDGAPAEGRTATKGNEESDTQNMHDEKPQDESRRSSSEHSETGSDRAMESPHRGGRRRAVRMVQSPLRRAPPSPLKLTPTTPKEESEGVVAQPAIDDEPVGNEAGQISLTEEPTTVDIDGVQKSMEVPSSEVTNEATTSSSSVERRLRSAKTSSTVFTETQVQRFSRESHEGMSPVIPDSPNTDPSLSGGPGIQIEGGSVRVDKRRLDWLTQELLAARDAINKKNLELHMSEKDKNDEKEVLLLEKQDAESVVSAMKQILAEREGELREARRRLSIAISGVSKRKVSARHLTNAEVEARIEAEAKKKAEVMIKERAAAFETKNVDVSRSPDKVSEFNDRFNKSDALTKAMAENSQAEMNRLLGEVQVSMEEKMTKMVDRRDAELAQLKRELARRQKAMDDLQEARLKLVDQNAQVQAEATSARQERELIIRQAAMEISQVQAQLVLVDKFSKKLHDTFKETELLRAQVADSQAKVAAISSHNGISAREARELRETVLKAQAEVDKWKEVAELAKFERMEAVNRAEEIGRLYQESAVRNTPQDHFGNVPSDGSGSGIGSGSERSYERSYEQQEPNTVVRHGSIPSVDREQSEERVRDVRPPPPTEPKAGARMWASIKNIVTGRKPPRKPRDRRPRQPGTPVNEEVHGDQSPAIPAPYSSPQLHARDFVQDYRGDGGIPTPPLSDYSDGESVKSPHLERQLSV